MSNSEAKTRTANTPESNSISPPDKLLDSCSPVAGFNKLTGGSDTGKIMKPQQDDLLAPLSAPKILACVIHRVLDDRGWLLSENYCPVPQQLQGLLPVWPRKVAFHPCVAETGENFIFPRKIDSPGHKPNSWNESLEEALAQTGQWMRVWPDSHAQRYHYEHARGPDEVLLEYPDFEVDLAASLSVNIIDRVDHPIIEAILAERQRIKALQDAKSDEELY